MRLWDSETVTPWQIHEALQPEYLIRAAGIIRRTRDSAARDAKWSLGDDLWVIGCTAWKRAVAAFGEASSKEYQDWLSTGYDEEHIHLIKIKGIPLRHYRALADEIVPVKHRATSRGEAAALALAFQRVDLIDGHFRFEVTTTAKGYTNQVTFVVVNRDGERLHPWPIPKHEAKAGHRRGSVRLAIPGNVPTSRKGKEA